MHNPRILVEPIKGGAETTYYDAVVGIAIVDVDRLCSRSMGPCLLPRVIIRGRNGRTICSIIYCYEISMLQGRTKKRGRKRWNVAKADGIVVNTKNCILLG